MGGARIHCIYVSLKVDYKKNKLVNVQSLNQASSSNEEEKNSLRGLGWSGQLTNFNSHSKSKNFKYKVRQFHEN